jgi:hypothetical protein
MDKHKSGIWSNTSTIVGLTLATLISGVMPAQAKVISTSGANMDMKRPATWAGGTVPKANDIANFAHSGIYTAPNKSIFSFQGITMNAPDVKIIPATGHTLTINLGTGGLSGSQPFSQLGEVGSSTISTDLGSVLLDVGANNQTWAITFNAMANLKGSATIQITGGKKTATWMRGNNSGFSGTWLIDGGQLMTSSEPGNDKVTMQLKNNGILRLATATAAIGNYTCGRIQMLGDGILLVSPASDYGNTVTTIRQPVSGSGNLTLGAGSGHVTHRSILNLAGRYTHRGHTRIQGTSAERLTPFEVNLTSKGSITFYIGTNGVNNAILESAARNVLNVNGTFVIDLSVAQAAAGNTWTLVDRQLDSVTYGGQFKVVGFTKAGTVWTRVMGDKTWTFSQTTGALTVALK